ncbi:hypothetical protein C8J57DRAFT_1514893 [Mycena rebaudengoi]|nr:hypothetical protein C8J57DRAFT_1514893 [Mycena rebaudengoi]
MLCLHLLLGLVPPPSNSKHGSPPPLSCTPVTAAASLAPVSPVPAPPLVLSSGHTLSFPTPSHSTHSSSMTHPSQKDGRRTLWRQPGRGHGGMRGGDRGRGRGGGGTVIRFIDDKDFRPTEQLEALQDASHLGSPFSALDQLPALEAHARDDPMDAAEIQTELNLSTYLGLISFSMFATYAPEHLLNPALGLLFYDYLLTLGWEITRYWGSPFTFPAALFYLNRYLTLLGNIPTVIQYVWMTPASPSKITVRTVSIPSICGHLVSYHQYFIILTQLIIGVMLIMRTYALYERNNRILTLLIVVSTAVVAVSLWLVIGGGSGKADRKEPPLALSIGCSSTVTRSEALSRRRGTRLDLLTVLLRDGSIYFGVMVFSNMSNIITFLIGTAFTRGILTTFTNVISSIMISRLMLNLRNPSLASMSNRRTVSTLASGSGGGIFSTFPELDTRALPHDGIDSVSNLYQLNTYNIASSSR